MNTIRNLNNPVNLKSHTFNLFDIIASLWPLLYSDKSQVILLWPNLGKWVVKRSEMNLKILIAFVFKPIIPA